MKQFRYEGHDRYGRKAAGRVKAENKQEAIRLLREQRVAPVKTEELTGILYKDISLPERLPLKEFVAYVRQFATLLKAGTTLVDATQILRVQTKHKKLKAALASIEESMREGKPYTEAAEPFSSLFPTLYLNMMKAGEAGGRMDDILERMADHYEKVQKTRNRIVSALAYPLAVMAVIVAIIFFLLLFVVPAFSDLLPSEDQLPTITQFVMVAGRLVGSYWWAGAAIVIALVVTISLFVRHKQSRFVMEKILLKTPIIGSVLQKNILATISRTLSTLFESSVPILEAVEVMAEISGSEVARRVLQDAHRSLERGESLSSPMKTHWLFPHMFTQMVVIGETSGTLDHMLDKIALFYEDEIDRQTELMKALLEPVMILILAISVGTIVSAITLPMFEIFKSVQS
ncbi:type II secretion system F family protein [Aureibacillus halotolerans]|uniref:Type IV pilus assembly protein PilC n=1 Tax=Aureibacillus halotolerans TaxID=1508390 RepID=A0A4R6TY94_9BACI|nr:type II secretion system F family protein [Aureibacillus halotolerans]TDQ38286.1 type IV pilus assembly protein PilC [Aureibacillus halotolerans]